MTGKDTLEKAYLAVMSNMESLVHHALNKIRTELDKDNEAEAYQAVLDTASLFNALFALQVVYRAKFEPEESKNNV